MANRRITIEIAGDASGARKAFGQADKAAKGFEGSISGVAKGVATSVGSAFALDQIVQWGSGFVGAAEESKKVAAQTDAVIESMGTTAGITADEVADLSEALSAKTGVDDELIQSGTNVLRTFGQLRDEAGKGNDVFTRATKAALDMSVALGQDLSSASMTVGKALNDPIRGLTALRRAGIQFTEQQEAQIRAMVEAGDVAGAQKIMLEELERQFGGSAEAQATATDKMRVAFGNLQEDIGGKLLPVVETAAGALEGMLSGGGGDIAATAGAIALGVGGIAAAAGTVIGPIRTAREALAGMGVTGQMVNTTLGKLGKGLVVGGVILGGIEALDAALSGLFPVRETDLDELTLDLFDFGKTARASGELAAIAGLDLGELSGAFDRVLDPSGFEQYEHAFQSVVTLGGRIADGSRDLTQAKTLIDDIDQALVALHAQSPELAAQAFDQLTAALGEQGIKAADVKASLDGYQSGLNSSELQNRATKESIDQTVQALKDQSDALTAQFSPLFGMVDAMQGHQQAQQRVVETQAAYNAAVAEFGANSPEALAAQQAFTEAQLGTSRSAFDLTQASLTLESAIASGEVALGDAQAQLADWVAQGLITQEEADAMAWSFGVAAGQADRLAGDYPVNVFTTGTGATVTALQAVTTAVNDIPKSTTIQIAFQVYGQAELNRARAMSDLYGNATGGEAYAGAPGWVGEAGKEIFIPEVNGRVLSHADSMRAVRAGAGGGGAAGRAGGDTIVFDMRGAIIAGESQFRGMVRDAWNDLAAHGAVNVRGRRVE